jgi:hypothetical protein
LLGPDFGHQFLDLTDVQVVDDDCDALAASLGHELGSFLNRFRPAPVIRGWQGLCPLLTGRRPDAGSQRRARAAPGAVHRRAATRGVGRGIALALVADCVRCDFLPECHMASTAVARKMVCYMLAVERRQQDFVPAEEFSRTIAV